MDGMGSAVNADGGDLDHYTRAEALVEALPDGRILLCCASSNPIRISAERMAWLHMPGADLTLLNSGRAPLLVSHGHDLESLIGAVDRAWIEGDRLLAVARIGSTTRARDALTLVRDRVLVNASIGFYGRIEEEPDGTGAHRIGWSRPYEVSLVTVPRNWDARVLDLAVPLRVRRMLAEAAAATASGTPATWRQWAEAAAGPIAAHAGLDAVAFETALTGAVEAELRRLASEAAQTMTSALQTISARPAGAAACPAIHDFGATA